MGKINFEIKWGQDDISMYDRSIKEIAKLQYFQRKYRMDIIEQIDIPDGDYKITIDIKELDKKIDWDSLPLPNEKVRQIIKGLEYYQDLSERLDKILGQIRDINFDKRYELVRLGKQAIAITSSFQPCEHFDNILTNKKITIADISHTLNQEVKILTNYIKHCDSQKKKNEAIYDATRHLTSDIERFKLGLDSIKLK